MSDAILSSFTTSLGSSAGTPVAGGFSPSLHGTSTAAAELVASGPGGVQFWASAPPLAGTASATEAAPGAARPAGGAGGGFGDPSFMYIVLLVIGGMFLFTILSQRKERKRRGALLDALKKHDRVQTIGGVIGSVVEVKGDLVVLKVDEASNTRMTFAKSAVQQVLAAAPE